MNSLCRNKIFFLSIILITFFYTPVFSQGVAVVLSGGGSRGTAHIGVLKALEEKNIPIDYITGTSIGAAVGALYAAGFSPDEIEKLVLSPDFNRWISGDIDPAYDYFYTKDAPDAGWIDLKLDFSNRYSKVLPSSAKSPVELDFVFMKLFSDATAVAGFNFDSLMIPFRCVAADIDSNRAVVFKKGDLARSVRASITFPFLFKPIEIDSKLFFDGGMYNNFPADVATQDFHPDVIIGSKVSGNYPKPDPDDVLSQIQNMLMTNTDFSLDTSLGIIIEPPLERVNIIDFSNSGEFIQTGYDETMKRMPDILEKVHEVRGVSKVDSVRRIFNEKKKPYEIDGIYIEGLNDKEAVYVYRSLTNKLKNPTIDNLANHYFRLAADDKLKLNGATMRYNPLLKKYDLYLRLKPANRFYLKFGGNISSRLANQAFVELNYRYLFQDALQMKMNVYFGRFYTSVLLGGRLDFPGQLPVFVGGNLVYNHFDYFKSTIHFIEDVTPSFLIQDDNYFRVYGGIPVSNSGKLEADFNVGLIDNEYYQNNIFSREDTADVTKFRFVKTGLNWEINTLNRKQYASTGARFRIATGLITGNEEFIIGSKTQQTPADPVQKHEWVCLDLEWDDYFMNIGKMRMGFYGRVHLSNQAFFSNYTASVLAAPSFKPLPESKTIFLPNYRAYNYGAAGFKVVWNFFRSFDLRTEVYMFQPYQQILQSEENTAYFGDAFKNRYWMANGALVYHTLVGPISLSLNYFDNPEEKFFIALNIGFIIFNKTALE